jgi:putative ABC transport system permease protein
MNLILWRSPAKKNGNYEPVVVRGVEPENFLAIEKASLVDGGYDDNFMLVGQGLSNRLDIRIGESLTITGSTSPAIIESTITGIFSSETASDEEILIPLSYARNLMGLGGDHVVIIRVKTEDQERLIDYLNEEEYSVVVGTVGGSIQVNKNETYEQKVAQELAIKYTDTSQFRATNQSFISTFIQRGASTVGVVVIGFIALNAILTFIGITAILARAVIERKKDIGILAAIGAGKRAIYFMLLKELLIISIIASGIGVAIGFISAVIVQNLNLIVAFGHTIQPMIDLTLFVITFFVAIIIGCISGLLVSSIILAEKPSKLMRDIEDVEEGEEVEPLTDAIGV